MRRAVATVERDAGGRALPGLVAARGAAIAGNPTATSRGAIVRQASTELARARTWRPAEQLEFLFGEATPRRRSGLRLVKRAAVVASVGADGALEAPDCGCLLIEEHLDRCILRGRS